MARQPDAGRKPLVLVVDDDPRQLELYRDSLERSGFEVLTAETSGDALASAAERRPHAVVLDVNLSGENSGYDVCRLLKDDARTGYIPVFIVTGKCMNSEDKLRGLRYGAVDYIVKPVAMEELAAKLHSYIRLDVGRDASSESTAAGRPCLGKVLIVDDSKFMQGTLRRILSSHGYEVTTADGGGQAIEKAGAFKPDVIIMDMVMPGMNGLETLKMLRVGESTKDIPVIMVTGVNNDSGVMRSAAAGFGAQEFLTKPVDPGRLSAQVRRFIEAGRKAVSAPSTARVQQASPNNALERGPIRVDINSRQVWVGGRKLKPLGPKLFDLLVLLFHYRDGATREKLREGLLGESGDTHIINVYVSRLRRRMGPKAQDFIISVGDRIQLAEQ